MDEKKILIIEDDLNIAELERDYLQLNGYNVELIYDGAEGLKKALSNKYELIIVDIMLPGKSGYDIVKEVREKSEVPIIIVSAKTEDIDKIRGLGFGADDYLTKPFSIEELLARLRVIQRRLMSLNQSNQASSVFVNGNLKIDYAAGCAFLGEEELHF